MSNQVRRSPQLSKISPILVASLMVAGNFQFIPAALAIGTIEGTTINNTATATYTDDENNPFETESNTVTVTVAEVAGLTAVPENIVDVDGGAIEAGDELEYNFRVTNIGNDETSLNIPYPGASFLENFVITPDPGIPSDEGVRVYTLDAGGNKVLFGYLQPNSTILNAAGSDITNTLILAPDEDIIVEVVGTPAPGTTAGQPISVTLGDTALNDNAANTQNQPDSADGALATDLRTVNETGDATDPTNGQREASAFQTVPFASDLNNLVALAQVSKNETNYTPGSLTDPTDDTISYDLGLSVATADPFGTYAPASLEGTAITLDGATATRILVSDVIPDGTVLQSVNPAALPSGWEVVYSISDPATTTPTNTVAGTTRTAAAAWTSTAPADLTTVTRIGFVYDGQLAPGYSTTGLTFVVRTAGATIPFTVRNISQLFGETVGDTGNNLVYDESGDNRPNNYDDDNTTCDDTAAGRFGCYEGDEDTGIPGENGETTDIDDNDGINDGQGPDGEELQRVLTIDNNPLGILNGPNGSPDAVGPDGTTSSDFTEKSTGDFVAGAAPAPITFTNTVRSTSAATLSNVTVEPVTNGADGVTGADIQKLPDGTTVTVSNIGGTLTAVYTVTGGEFVLTTGIPVNLGNIPVGGADLNYSVTVQLPATGSDPSAGTVADPNRYVIPMLAFADDDPAASPGYTGETTQNLTLNNLYGEFIVLAKEVSVNGGAFTTTPQDILPGDEVTYRITYTSITVAEGSGNANDTLTASNFLIEEDGTIGGANGNNWALDNDGNGVVDTLHQNGATATSGAGTIYFYVDSADTNFTNFNPAAPAGSTTDPADNGIVEAYINLVGDVGPGEFGTFTFTRALQ